MNCETPRYKVLHGVVSNLTAESIHVHYLKNIKKEQQMAGAVALLQAVSGQNGAVNSTQTAMSEGDPVEGFVMQVAGKTVRGSFWKTTFKNGERVQVIGQENDDEFNAVAVVKPEQRIIWMLPHCERGTYSQKSNLMKCSSWFVIVMYFCALLSAVFTSWPAWLAFSSFSIAIFIVLLVTVVMSWGDFMSFAREMNAVGEALGVPSPEKIDLFKSTKQAKNQGNPDLPLGVYYF